MELVLVWMQQALVRETRQLRAGAMDSSSGAVRTIAFKSCSFLISIDPVETPQDTNPIQSTISAHGQGHTKYSVV